MTEKERSRDEQGKKRRRWRPLAGSDKAKWPVPGRRTLAGGGFLGIIIGVIVAVLALWIFNQLQPQGQPPAVEVQREPVFSAGPNPFMSPVGNDQPSITSPVNTGGRFPGSTPGLFGETGDTPSCDAQSLVANLQADPLKGSSWASVLGLRAETIPDYVASLLPVVLRSDTAVTSYGYKDDHFYAYPAVLQAGTAVLINSYGEPKVKCFSGDPLTAAMSYPEISYVGSSWQNFEPTSITVIERTPTIINNYTMINIVKEVLVYRPAPRPRHNDDNWYCKKHTYAKECQGGMSRTPPSRQSPPSTYQPPPTHQPPPNTYQPPPTHQPPPNTYQPPPTHQPPITLQPSVTPQQPGLGNRSSDSDNRHARNPGE